MQSTHLCRLHIWMEQPTTCQSATHKVEVRRLAAEHTSMHLQGPGPSAAVEQAKPPAPSAQPPTPLVSIRSNPCVYPLHVQEVLGSLCSRDLPLQTIATHMPDK